MKNKKKSLWLSFDRVLAHDLKWQVLILIGVLAATFLISWLLLTLSGDEWSRFCERKNISPLIAPLYLLIDGNAFNNLYMGEDSAGGITVFIGLLVYLAGVVVFTGMLIAVLSNMIARRVEDHRNGVIRYLRSGHYIIMGWDEMVPSFICHIFEKDSKADVLILSSVKSVNISEKLQKSFSKEQLKRIVINYGHRTSAEGFKEIHLEAAEQIYVVGYHKQSAHDAVNVECVDSICSYLENASIRQKPSRIVCVFRDLDTYAAFKTTEIFRKVNDLGIEFVPYNSYSGWAKQVFVKRKYKDYNGANDEYEYPAVYGKGITPDDEKYVHLVFVGTTNFAVAFAMEAANVLHFPNFNKNEKGVRTRITFIDKNADKEKDEFITRNRHFFEVQSYLYYDLSDAKETEKQNQGARDEYVIFDGGSRDFLDVEFEFIKGDVFSKTVQDEISKWAGEHNKKQYLSVFLALSEQRENFVMGMNMPDEVYANDVPVFIRQDRSDNFVTNLRLSDKERSEKKHFKHYEVTADHLLDEKDQKAKYSNIYPFGMNESAYSADEVSLKRAKLINYLYETADYPNSKFKGILSLDAMSDDEIWDAADKFWQSPKLTVALKWSNLYSAYTIRTKMASLRIMRGLDLNDSSRDTWPLSDEEVEKMAIVEHNRWNVEKLLMGFRKPHKEEDKYAYPEYQSDLKKNKDLFAHHDIRPFDQLGSVKELDYEFSRYIPWILRMTEK